MILLNPNFLETFFAVYINEVGNDVSTKAVDVVTSYIKKNPNLGLSVEISSIEGNRSDSKGLLEASESSKLNFQSLKR
jgi:hypothetical protein